MAKRTAGKFARLSLDYFDHPKLASVSDGAIVAHLHMIVYCRKYLTDGRVPKQIASRFESKLLSELAHNDDERPSITIHDDGSVTLHDYGEWQETRADLETKSQVRAAAGRKGGRPAKANGKQNAKQTESKLPSKPKAEEEEEEENTSTTYLCAAREEPTPAPSTRKKPATRIPDDWAPTDSHRDYARERNLNLEREAEAYIAHAHANDRRLADWNAGFRMWLTKARPDTGSRPTKPTDGVLGWLDLANELEPTPAPWD